MNIFRYEQQVKHIVTDLLSIISAVICFDWWSSLSCFICSGSDLFFFDLKEIPSSWSSTWFLLWVFLLWSLWLDSLSTKRRQVRGQSRFCRTLSFEFLWRGVVGGAAAGEVNAPAGHLQWCLAGLKVCWVLDFSVVVVVGVYVREQLESLNCVLTATVWIKWCWKAYRCGRVCHDFITLFHPAVITVRLRARVYWEWLLDNKTRSQS